MQSSELLRRSRRRAGISQGELARRSGSSQAAVARREHGAEEPTVTTLRRLLYACGRRLVLSDQPLPDTPARRRLGEQRNQIVELAARRGATNVRLFGSFARGEERLDSDLDLLVDLPDELSSGSRLLQALGLGEELSELLGLRVQVADPRLLKPQVRRSALREGVPL